MRSNLPEALESGRILTGPMASSPDMGTTGMFHIRGPIGEVLRIVASGADAPGSEGWEHVSISCQRRCPLWDEMCFVKDLFWEAEECAVQYHPPASEYVNNHPYVLHLFRHVSMIMPMPPSIMVGIKGLGVIKSVAEAKAVRDLYFRRNP